MEKIGVSAIMTVKNGEDYLESSLSSILDQTWPPQEIVVVNDGSTDSTWKKLQSIQRGSPIPLKMLNTTGIGRAKALNLAVKNSVSPWLANLDVDDLWLPTKLENQAKVIRVFPEAQLVSTASQVVYGDGEVNLDVGGDFSVSHLGRKSFYIRNPINHSSILFSRWVYDRLGGYNEMMSRQIDIDLWVRALIAGCVFHRVNIPLTVKRLHDRQSYEYGRRLEYTKSALKVSLKKLKALNAPACYFAVPYAKFVYNNIPRRLRRRIFR